MKRLIYLSALLLGLITMSCSKDKDGASIVGIWNYSSAAIYSDGNLVPSSDYGDYLDMDGITFEFQEGGTVIIIYSAFPIPISGGYTFDKSTGILTISITDFGGIEMNTSTIHVQNLTASEMMLVQTENTDEYYKDGKWLIETDNEKKHTLRTEVALKRQ